MIPTGSRPFQKKPSKKELAEFALYQFLESKGPEFLRPWKRAFPELAKTFYIWSLDEVSEEAFREDLGKKILAGRKWPDIYLKLRAKDVLSGEWTVEDLVEYKELGIFSDKDFKRIYEFLGGR